MLKKLITLALLAIIACSASINQEQLNGNLPAFCRGLDCPEFTVLKQLDDNTEIRQYQSYKWATISYEIEQPEQYYEVSSKAFHQLFDYIDGQNVENVKIPMASPVLNVINPGQGPACSSLFTMGFFVPFEYQDNPIAPSNSNIEIKELSGVFGVRSFPGRIVEFPYNEFNDLVETLQKNNYSFNDQADFIAGYDSPFVLVNRHNEVWLQIE